MQKSFMNCHICEVFGIPPKVLLQKLISYVALCRHNMSVTALASMEGRYLGDWEYASVCIFMEHFKSILNSKFHFDPELLRSSLLSNDSRYSTECFMLLLEYIIEDEDIRWVGLSLLSSHAYLTKDSMAMLYCGHMCTNAWFCGRDWASTVCRVWQSDSSMSHHVHNITSQQRDTPVKTVDQWNVCKHTAYRHSQLPSVCLFALFSWHFAPLFLSYSNFRPLLQSVLYLSVSPFPSWIPCLIE